mmetsp:Transcript_4153/g.9860  ORF Transcript_4153/g.9860 Transcript_4153/m.9860 type:complete len:209 (+) Transcript_4153:263-889(+)
MWQTGDILRFSLPFLQLTALAILALPTAMANCANGQAQWAVDLSVPSHGTAPSARTKLGMAASDSKLYIFGGDVGSADHDLHMHEYSLTSRSWTDLSSPHTGSGSFPSARVGMGMAASNSKLYIFGGWTEQGSFFTSALHEYDIASGAWMDLWMEYCSRPMSMGRCNPYAAVDMGMTSLNSKLYVFGGNAPGLFRLKFLYEYDIASRV